MPYRYFLGGFSVSKICGLVGCLGVVTLFTTVVYDGLKKVFHAHFLRRARRLQVENDTQSGHNDNSSTGVRMAIYIELLTLITHMMVVVLSLLSITDDRQCRRIIPIHFFLFHLSSGLLYLIFVRRIELIYADTLFKLPFYHIFNLYAGIALYSMPYLVYVDWFLIETRFDPEFGCTLHPISFSSFLLAIATLLHTLIALYALYLFVYPIHHLIQQQESFNNPRVSDKLYLVMIKYSILYSCSITSSLVLLVLSITCPVGYIWSLVSSLTNGIVLILLHPIQNKLYTKCCCCLPALCRIAWGAPRDLTRKSQAHKYAKDRKDTDDTTSCTPEPNLVVATPSELRARSPPPAKPSSFKNDSSNLPHASSILSFSNQEHLTVRITSLKSPSNTTFRHNTVSSPPLTMVPEDLSHELYSQLHDSNVSAPPSAIGSGHGALGSGHGSIPKDECPLELASPPMFVRGPSTSLALECGLSPRSTVRTTERITSLSPRAVASPVSAFLQSPTGASKRLSASECVFSMSINLDINSEMATQKKVAPMMSVVVEPSLPDVMESVEEEEVLPRSPTLRDAETQVHLRSKHNALGTVDVAALWNSTCRITPMSSTNGNGSRRGDMRLMLSATTTRSHLPEVGSLGGTMQSIQASRNSLWSRSIQDSDRLSKSWQNVDTEVAESFQNSIIKTLRFLDAESSQLY